MSTDCTADDVSRTSQVVALMRSKLKRPVTAEGDPQAQKKLCFGMRPTPVNWPISERTRFFDEHVLSAIAVGVRQIVVLGAGYDDRALRFRTSGVMFFELDHPSTQMDKAQRLKSMKADLKGLRLVPTDFRLDDVAAKLALAGQNADEATLFICEGLLVYLSQQVGCRLLAGLRSRAAAGSVLAASLAIHRVGLDSKKVALAINARRRVGETESWLTILQAEEYLELFKQAGWIIDCVKEAKQGAVASYGGRGLVTASPSVDA